MKNLRNDRRGVFGLNAVQSFFAIILGIALLAYVIVIIMGTLGGSTILQQAPPTTATFEAVTFDAVNTHQTLAKNSLPGGTCIALSGANNGTAIGKAVAVANFTQNGCDVINATAMFGNSPANPWNASYTIYFNYTYTQNSDAQNNLNSVLGNTSTGITSFFGSISPVYAILAVLVIILVLVVLVRVVQAPNERSNSPQL
jgi:predicted PurR-regulated permease PerM